MKYFGLSTSLSILCLLVPFAGYAHGDEDHRQDQRTLPSPPLTKGGGGGTSTGESGEAGAMISPLRLADGSVLVPKPAQRLLGIRTVLAEIKELAQTVELKGHVVPDPNASGRVQASQAGRIEAGPNGLPSLGQKVRKGQVLAYLNPVAAAIERGNQQAQLVELTSQLGLAEKRVARLEQLAGSIPQKEIDAARAELQSLTARKTAVAASLYRREPLIAPVSGVLSGMSASVGHVVDAREVLFEIIDPQRLWVDAVAYDMKLTDQITSAAAQGATDQTIPLTFLGSGYQLREQAVPLQFRLDPPLPPISVGEKMKLFVQTKQMVKGAPIPQASITRASGGESLVWVHASAELFVPRKVKVQALDGTSVAVLEGLQAGDRVVTQGATLLSQVR